MPEWVGVFAFGMALLLLFSAVGVPIAFSLMLSGLIGLLVFRGSTVALGAMKTNIFGAPNEIALVPIPLFILMASLLIGAGISQRAYDAFTRLFGGFKAGLPLATNALLAGMGALMGSSAASIGMVTQMGAPELTVRGYSKSIIAGVIAGGSGLAVVIPPSILIILYAFVMENPIIPLFAGGIIPGFMMAIGYGVWIWLYIKWKPPVMRSAGAASTIGPGAGKNPGAPPEAGVPEAAASTVRGYFGEARLSEEAQAAIEGRITPWGRLKALGELVPIFIVAVGMLGAMFLGYASITEGAAVGVFGVLVLGLLFRSLTIRGTLWGLWNAIRISGFVMFLIVGGRYFGLFFNLTGVTQQFTTWITGLTFQGVLLVLTMMGIFLFLGAIMETISIMLVLVPIAAGALVALGFDPIWVGILFVVNLEMALTTPPIGVNLFVLAGLSRPYGITFEDIVRGTIPFLVVDAIVIVLMAYNPILVTFLADLVK